VDLADLRSRTNAKVAGILDCGAYNVMVLPKPRQAQVGETQRKVRNRLIEELVGAVCNPAGATAAQKEENELWTLQALARRNGPLFSRIAKSELRLVDLDEKFKLTGPETWELVSASGVAPSVVQKIGHFFYRAKGFNPMAPEKVCAAIKLESKFDMISETVYMKLKQDNDHLTAVHYVILKDIKVALVKWIQKLHERGHFVHSSAEKPSAKITDYI
jgi:hypothetical protein